MRIHPLAAVFPPIEGPCFDALVEDIKVNGLLNPIVTLDGAILDGRNRFNACKAAGVKPEFESYGGADPLAFVISLNCTRRHLSESQRAMVAARLATLKKGANQHSSIELPTQDDAATRLNVGLGSVKRARAVLDSKDKQLIGSVDRGEISVSRAAKIAREQTGKTNGQSDETKFRHEPVMLKGGQDFNIDSALSFLTRLFAELYLVTPDPDRDRVAQAIRMGLRKLESRRVEVVE